MTINAPELLHALLEISHEAGARILEIYDSEFEVESKADESPLTAADLASHNTITEALGKLTPDVPVLSEESAAIPYEVRSGWEEYWLVDPLDGTKEFVKRNGEFTVNIALVRGNKPILGVVHVPVTGVDYYGCEGVGAFRARPGEEIETLRVQPLGEAPIRVVGSRSHKGELLDAYLERLGPHEMVPMGSSLKLCLVAAGDADVYPRLGLTSEWDTAAAQAVVEAAGGHVIDTDGNALSCNTKPEYLNPFFIVYGDESRDWTSYLA